MGQLPESRVNQWRPFQISGVDFCGPVQVRLGLRRPYKVTKAYVAVFICFIVKAVHLELVSDLSSEAFLAALRRFIARRGKCSYLYSDNAKNFCGTERNLRELREMFIEDSNFSKISKEMAGEGIVWKFTPPYSPHFGGLWESAVKSFKYHFRRVVGNSVHTFEELSTIICQIEAVINSRPLTPLSTDPDDVTCLTPSHFLIGDNSVGLPEPSLLHIPENRLSAWQKLQSKIQNFWKRWSREYLTSLQERNKWRERNPNVKVGDVVLIKEPNVPPYVWKLGRIMELHQGDDGLVRVITMKTAKGNLTRSIKQICPLPMDNLQPPPGQYVRSCKLESYPAVTNAPL